MSEEDPVASARNKDIENTNNYTIFLILDLYFSYVFMEIHTTVISLSKYEALLHNV
jgi:hypothetical protein